MPSNGSERPAARSAFAKARRQVGRARHHLAGRAHLRAEHRIGAGEASERQHRRLDADLPRRPFGRQREVELGGVAPAASRQAASTRFTPVAFDANGTVRDARGFTSST